MNEKTLVEMYEREGALLDGHFMLRSGMHSEKYLQSALLLARPEMAERAGAALGEMLDGLKPDLVLSPATGGIVIGQETARALGTRAFFAERVKDRFQLRRGFTIGKGERVVVVEDIVTTGGSVELVLDMVEEMGGRAVAVGALIDRSDGRTRFSVPFHPVAKLKIQIYSAERCPMCQAGIPIRKPGSRGLSRS